MVRVRFCLDLHSPEERFIMGIVEDSIFNETADNPLNST
jgi:hypothetical protein